MLRRYYAAVITASIVPWAARGRLATEKVVTTMLILSGTCATSFPVY